MVDINRSRWLSIVEAVDDADAEADAEADDEADDAPALRHAGLLFGLAGLFSLGWWLATVAAAVALVLRIGGRWR